MPNLLVRSLSHITSACLLLLLTACAEAPAQSLATLADSPSSTSSNQPEPVAAPEKLSFADWRALLRSDAIAAGIDPALFDRAFAGVSPNPDVLVADSSQPEFTRPVWEYLDGAVSPLRVARGQSLLLQHGNTLARIETRYGVDRETLVAIWGLESNFGSNIGTHNVIRSLATLAYECRRQVFWRSQLLAVLQILQHGDITPERLVGSWADAVASTAHSPQTWGWQKGQPWGYEVRLPQAFDYSLADPEVRRSLAEWTALGVAAVTPPARHLASETMATLLLPAGHRGPAFLLLSNFRSILKYNNSTSYALAIGLLSDG